ncbi:MAG TPA: TIGR00730 family Rossman fold protein [Hyphomicrobiales bacterium]|nr:TIGR00730 family Rossman fold protein [Kaistiaceae bacterium]HQF29960.1 TIGR00730 family Rossman fold protein [Hyphomicrobiales bacterium]
MAKIESICVYCGSASGKGPHYAEAAERLGTLMAEASIELVYGGGSVGLMGTVARAVIAGGGRVTGIIPQFLEAKELAERSVTELIVTADMHERKRTMFERADAFVALPGGIGTLEELVEMMTWAQLGRHEKPVLIANIGNFWEPLVDLLGHMTEAGFIRKEYAVDYLVADRVEDIVPMLAEAAAATSRAALDETADTGDLARL